MEIHKYFCSVKMINDIYVIYLNIYNMNLRGRKGQGTWEGLEEEAMGGFGGKRKEENGAIRF